MKFLSKFWQIYWEDYQTEIERGEKHPVMLLAWYWGTLIMFIAGNIMGLGLIIFAVVTSYKLAIISGMGFLAFIWYIFLDYTLSGGQYRRK